MEHLRYGRVQHACVCLSVPHPNVTFFAQLVSLFSQSADLRNRVTFATAQAIHSLFHALEQYEENIDESNEEDEDAMFKHIRYAPVERNDLALGTLPCLTWLGRIRPRGSC